MNNTQCSCICFIKCICLFPAIYINGQRPLVCWVTTNIYIEFLQLYKARNWIEQYELITTFIQVCNSSATRKKQFYHKDTKWNWPPASNFVLCNKVEQVKRSGYTWIFGYIWFMFLSNFLWFSIYLIARAIFYLNILCYCYIIYYINWRYRPKPFFV